MSDNLVSQSNWQERACIRVTLEDHDKLFPATRGKVAETEPLRTAAFVEDGSITVGSRGGWGVFVEDGSI